jgi:hypothetical protein
MLFILVALIGWGLVAYSTFWVTAEFGAAIGIVYFFCFSGLCFMIPALIVTSIEEVLKK